MADKNLHDIKIDDIDGSKKTPLKNILTLLALLFIILVISVVITKLILNTDEGKEIENNLSTSTLATTDLNSDSTNVDTSTHAVASSDAKNDDDKVATVAAATAAVAAAVPVIKNAITDRNLTSVTKDSLRTHTPAKKVKEVKELNEVKKVKEASKPKTYKIPKHTSTSTKHVSTPKRTPSPKKHVTSHSSSSSKNSTPKKSYKDKVVTRKAPSHTTKKTTTKTTTRKASYLGGKLKAVTNSYYVKVGTYRDYSAVLSKIKKINFNYSLVKLKDDKTMTRVYIGPFFSRNEAQKNMSKIKSKVMPSAYITKAK